MLWAGVFERPWKMTAARMPTAASRINSFSALMASLLRTIPLLTTMHQAEGLAQNPAVQ
jgi:hypothetical protein